MNIGHCNFCHLIPDRPLFLFLRYFFGKTCWDTPLINGLVGSNTIGFVPKYKIIFDRVTCLTFGKNIKPQYKSFKIFASKVAETTDLFLWGILGFASRAEFPVSLSNDVRFTPRLFDSCSTHHFPEGFIHLKAGWAQDAWLHYFHVDIRRWLIYNNGSARAIKCIFSKKKKKLKTAALSLLSCVKKFNRKVTQSKERLTQLVFLQSKWSSFELFGPILTTSQKRKIFQCFLIYHRFRRG